MAAGPTRRRYARIWAAANGPLAPLRLLPRRVLLDPPPAQLDHRRVLDTPQRTSLCSAGHDLQAALRHRRTTTYLAIPADPRGAAPAVRRSHLRAGRPPCRTLDRTHSHLPAALAGGGLRGSAVGVPDRVRRLTCGWLGCAAVPGTKQSPRRHRRRGAGECVAGKRQRGLSRHGRDLRLSHSHPLALAPTVDRTRTAGPLRPLVSAFRHERNVTLERAADSIRGSRNRRLRLCQLRGPHGGLRTDPA